VYKIVIRGDFQGKVDTRLLEGYLKRIVEDASGEPVARVSYHGVVRQSIDDLRAMMTFRPQDGGR
jgi:hypothetical protein